MTDAPCEMYHADSGVAGGSTFPTLGWSVGDGRRGRPQTLYSSPVTKCRELGGSMDVLMWIFVVPVVLALVICQVGEWSREW